MPRGIPKALEGASQRTIELQQALAASQALDRARSLLITFAQKHQLTAGDLRMAAKVLATRKVGDAPVMSKRRKLRTSTLRPAKGKIGKAIRAARLKANMTDEQVGAQIGAHASAVQKWQLGIYPVPERYHAGLLRVLKLPKGLLPNGAAHAS